MKRPGMDEALGLSRRWRGLVAVVAIACGGGQPVRVYGDCFHAEPEVRKAILDYLIRTYDELPPQFDDPVGRNYCLGFDFRFDQAGTAPPEEFVRQFSGHPRVHALEWCEQNAGRLISVGPITCENKMKVRAWSFTWIESRPGGSDCLHELEKTNKGWKLEAGCLKGKVYN